MNTIRIIIVGCLLGVSAFAADDRTLMPDVRLPAGMHLAGGADPAATKVYIVQLREPAAALAPQIAGGQVMSKATPGSPMSPVPFDKNSAVVQSHVQKISDEQDRVISRLGGGLQKLYSYKYALNGFAARMTPLQADKLRGDDAVARVWEDEIRPLATRTSPTFLGLFDRDNGLRGSQGLDGDGIVVGVIDSGITPNHPSLSDTREADRPGICSSAWGESTLLGTWLCRSFTLQDDVLEFEPPENWNGFCESGDGFPEDSCNNKLIGARFFVEGAQATLPIDPDELLSPADAFGHGTHVATIAAGNKSDASIFGTALGRIEGVAPRARIAAYKACWVRTGETNATCNTSDLANAIDAAVADGVDVINYSVGSSLLVATAPDDLALITAAKAGVLTVVAAGNDGPNLATIGSPAGNPAVISVAASSRDGQHSLEAMQVTSPASVAGRYEVREASFTPPLTDSDPIEAELVLVDDDDDSSSTTYDGCEPLVNGSEVSGKIAFMQRGGCDFDVKIENADNAGALAALVFNIAGDPIVMTGDSGFSDIPALMMGQADGDLLFDEIDGGETVEVVLEKGLLLTVDDDGNVMGSFSSRGPGPVNDILKPDLTAPGINILAGNSPASITSVPDEEFAFITGTSMSAPHVTGIAALLIQAHPDWSPAAIKSALLTTARQDVLQQDGETDAHPFDFGAGHVQGNPASNPGLVYDMNDDDYDAYSCAVLSPGVTSDRCGDLDQAGIELLPAGINLPSISVGKLTAERTVSRRVTNVSDESQTYTAEVTAPAGIDVQVVPSSLTLGPGQTASFDVTMKYQSGSLDLWRFGSLTWNGNDHSVRSPLAVRPASLSAPAELASFGGTGTLSFPVQFGYNGTYLPQVHGLKRADVTEGFVDQDPTLNFSFRNGNGVTAHVKIVSPDQAYVRFVLRDEFTDGDDDLDMYVYYSSDGESFSRVGQSGEFNSDETFSLFRPPEGFYAVLVHGFATDSTDPGGPGANYKLLSWEFGFDDDVGNMTASGPATVTAGAIEDITVDWVDIGTDSIYLGGISHNTPQGFAGLTIISIRN